MLGATLRLTSSPFMMNSGIRRTPKLIPFTFPAWGIQMYLKYFWMSHAGKVNGISSGVQRIPELFHSFKTCRVRSSVLELPKQLCTKSLRFPLGQLFICYIYFFTFRVFVFVSVYIYLIFHSTFLLCNLKWVHGHVSQCSKYLFSQVVSSSSLRLGSKVIWR